MHLDLSIRSHVGFSLCETFVSEVRSRLHNEARKNGRNCADVRNDRMKNKDKFISFKKNVKCRTAVYRSKKNTI